MARGVYSRSGIDVVLPVAARAVMAVDDHVGDQHLLQLLSSDDAGDSCTDHDNRELPWHRRRLGIEVDGKAATSAEFLGEHLPVATVDWLPHTDTEHLRGLIRPWNRN